MTPRKKLVLLGATGSIGSSALKVLRGHRDRLELIGVSAYHQKEKLLSVVKEFRVPHAHLVEETKANLDLPAYTNFTSGKDELDTLAALPEADIILVAVVGTAGLSPTLAALKAGKVVVLANKESLVLGGKIVMETAEKFGGRIIPADSEHNAIHQCLLGQDARALDSVILTASGGAFRDLPLMNFKK